MDEHKRALLGAGALEESPIGRVVRHADAGALLKGEMRGKPEQIALVGNGILGIRARLAQDDADAIAHRDALDLLADLLDRSRAVL